MNASGPGPDRSLADYTWCKFAAERGLSIEEIAAELATVSTKARERIANRGPGYVTKTAENGAAAGCAGTPAEPSLSTTIGAQRSTICPWFGSLGAGAPT
jgi:hypothetical protein